MRRFAWLIALSALAGPSSVARANVFSRADDTRVAAPEQWKKRRDFGLDLSLGGSYLSGNVDHLAVAPAAKFQVNLGRHQLFVDGNANYSAFSGNAVIDRQRGSVLYAYALREKLNVFGYTTHAHNSFIELDYRTTNSVGLCVHSFFGDEETKPLVSLGLTPELEWWSDGTTERALRASLRASMTAVATSHLRLGVDLLYEPAVTDVGDYRLYAESYAELKITDETVALRISVTDEFDSRPKPDVGKNDVTVIPSLVVKTGR